MAVKKWSKKQRTKFMATLKARKTAGGWGRGRKTLYSKPKRVSINNVGAGEREVIIRIQLV